jgi:hypothetical protein
MNEVPIFIQIQKLWQPLGTCMRFLFLCRSENYGRSCEIPLHAQILNGIFVPTTYTQKLNN